jgi:phosphomannomutase / phosphoglucomutase
MPSLHGGQAKCTPIPTEIFQGLRHTRHRRQNADAGIVEQIGHALGSEARARGKATSSSAATAATPAELAAALARGISAAGINVIDLGRVATPMAYFAAHHLGCQCAAMVTGSHNPPDYNGIKMVLAGETLFGDHSVACVCASRSEDFSHGSGGYRQYDIADPNTCGASADVKLARPLNIVVDAGNGVAGAFAPALFRALGCRWMNVLRSRWRFPASPPRPSVPANLADLIAHLQTSDAEIGLAFDGDGDRLGVVTKTAEIIFPDRQLMLFAEDVLARNPDATIIFDIKSSRNLFSWIGRAASR